MTLGLLADGVDSPVKDKLHASGLSLSGGQQQRLCIAWAIATDPEVLLMDEPCSALDPIATRRIEELMIELRARYTIAIVTHNLQQAKRVAIAPRSCTSTRPKAALRGISSSSATPIRSSTIPRNVTHRNTCAASSAERREFSRLSSGDRRPGDCGRLGAEIVRPYHDTSDHGCGWRLLLLLAAVT